MKRDYVLFYDNKSRLISISHGTFTVRSRGISDYEAKTCMTTEMTYFARMEISRKELFTLGWNCIKAAIRECL